MSADALKQTNFDQAPDIWLDMFNSIVNNSQIIMFVIRRTMYIDFRWHDGDLNAHISGWNMPFSLSLTVFSIGLALFTVTQVYQYKLVSCLSVL